MTAIHDQCDVIRGWLNLGDAVYPDSVVTSWIRMAEEKLSSELRIADMIQIDTGTLIDQRYQLPPDWREMDFVRHVQGRPLRYTPRDDFYNPDEPYKSDQKKCYTIIGRYIVTGLGDSSGPDVEISYYGDIPPLGDVNTWLQNRYPTLFTFTTLNIASLYSIDDDRQPTWKAESDSQIASLNSEHRNAKASGSRLTVRHRRSFG